MDVDHLLLKKRQAVREGIMEEDAAAKKKKGPGDLSTASASTAQAEVKAATRGASSKDKGLEDITRAMAQLVVTNARDIATIQSTLNHVTLFQADKIDLLAPVKTTTKAYNESQKGISPAQKAKMLPPHVFVFNTTLQVIHKELNAKSDPLAVKITNYTEAMGAVAKQQLTEQGVDPELADTEVITNATMELMLTEIKLAKCSLCWDKVHQKLELSAVPGTPTYQVLETVQKALVKYAAGEKKLSQAPKGRLERKIAEWIDSHKD